jgi:hypothetical protein
MSGWYARLTRNRALQEVDWPTSNRLFLATFAGGLAALYIVILLVDPYGVVPFSPPFERPIMSTQRQMYPQILRTGRYDSIVVGTSTSRLLDPVELDRALGGRFANLTLLSGTAREQIQVIDYFRRTVARPKTVLIGLDHEWCYRDGNAYLREQAAAREREFPSWAFDNNRWNDLLYLLNSPTLEVAGRTVAYLLGRMPEMMRADGYEGVALAEAAYDLARVRDKIWGPDADRALGAIMPAPEARGGARDAREFPALPWLDESLASLPAWTRKILIFPPIHAHALPKTGSPRAALEAECKNRVAAIARKRGAVLADWRIPSSIAAEDTHFWDLVHYRLSISHGLIDDLGHIVNEGRESPDGSYRILVR